MIWTEILQMVFVILVLFTVEVIIFYLLILHAFKSKPKNAGTWIRVCWTLFLISVSTYLILWSPDPMIKTHASLLSNLYFLILMLTVLICLCVIWISMASRSRN